MADKYKGKTAKEWAELAEILEGENRGLIDKLEEQPGPMAAEIDRALTDFGMGRIAATIPLSSTFVVSELNARREYTSLGDLGGAYDMRGRGDLEARPQTIIELKLHVLEGLAPRARRGRRG